MNLMNTKSLAEYFGISRYSLYNILSKINKNELPSSCLPPWIVIGRTRYWYKDVVDNWLKATRFECPADQNGFNEANDFDHSASLNCIMPKRKRGRPRSSISFTNPLA